MMVFPLVSTSEIMAVTKASAFDRIGGRQPVKNKVCVYWRQGRCNRNPCRFMHSESPPPKTEQPYSAMSRKNTWRNPNGQLAKNDGVLSKEEGGLDHSKTKSVQPKIVRYNARAMDDVSASVTNDSGLSKEEAYLDHNKTQYKIIKINEKMMDHVPLSVQKEPEKDSSGFTMLAKLEGHSKSITGIALPSGFDKLYTGGKDKCVRAWDCRTGQCVGTLSLDGEVGCLISEGQWVFVGSPNSVKAWNIQNQSEFSLKGTFGQVHCIAVDDDMIFAGIEDGTILVWKYNPETKIPEPVAILRGHNGVVHSLVIGTCRRLYSASRDCTIKVWGLQDLQCMQTLHGHTSDVMSLICWKDYLISASLDNRVKVWGATEKGTIEVVGGIKDDNGVIALCGIDDKEAKPILLCSYTDNSVRLYDLPSFTERGRISFKQEVHVIELGIDGLFFTGDETGEVSVWNILGVPQATS